eukprot:c14951_g1_i1.p1 GENE.c14951_g1_i1~~c14951_g1_i1.p1  ORF type:complete len:183 (-),score=31.84 c14951_g1_i1:111-638(-)
MAEEEGGDTQCVVVEPASKGLLVPPINFGMVMPGIFRSGYPAKKNLDFLHRIGIRSVVVLCPETYSDSVATFFEQKNVKIFQVGMEGNKEPFCEISEPRVCDALALILNKANHPLLIHCNKGKHRTGCVVGCLRRVHNWALTSIFEEYNRYAGTKGRVLDLQFIELFEPSNIKLA